MGAQVCCSPVACVYVVVLPCCHVGRASPTMPSLSSGRRDQTHSGAVVPWGTPHLCLIWRKAKELDGIPQPSLEAVPRESDLLLAVAWLSLGRYPNTLEPLGGNEIGTATSC